jgi:hypothetical protein
VRHDLLGVLEALGIGEGRHGGVDLVGGVRAVGHRAVIIRAWL